MSDEQGNTRNIHSLVIDIQRVGGAYDVDFAAVGPGGDVCLPKRGPGTAALGHVAYVDAAIHEFMSTCA